MNGRLTASACHALLCWLLTWGLGQTNSAMATRAIVAAVVCVPNPSRCWAERGSALRRQDEQRITGNTVSARQAERSAELRQPEAAETPRHVSVAQIK